MADVFISYARKDSQVVNRLADALMAAGIEIWIDSRHLPKGREFFLEIEKALDEAICVVVCWTTNALRSRVIYDEVNQAAEDGKLIPVRLDDVKPPLGWRSLQHIDLLDWATDETATGEIDRLVSEIKSRTRKSSAKETSRSAGFSVCDSYESGFDRKFKLAVEGLIDELKYIDAEFQFQNNWFTPLYAEVDIHSGPNFQDHKIADLLTSIETDKSSRIFLVLGDPGAGKSVAMRELARHGLSNPRRKRKSCRFTSTLESGCRNRNGAGITLRRLRRSNSSCCLT
jgi:hypothetical protein